MEIKNVKTEETTVEVGEKIKISFEIEYKTDFPFDFKFDFPISTTKK